MTARNAELVTSHEGNGSSGVGLEQVRLKSSPKRFMPRPRIARMKRDLDAYYVVRRTKEGWQKSSVCLDDG